MNLFFKWDRCEDFQVRVWAAVGRKMVPERCLLLIPGTPKYNTLYGKRDFGGEIRLRTLR